MVEAPSRLLVANVIAQIAFGLLAMTICLPSMQEWGALFGAPQASVQLTFSGYVIAYGAMQLVYGPLSDRYGRKRLMMVGLIVGGLASLVAATASSLPALVAARVWQGAGGAASLVVGRAAIQDLFAGPQRLKVMAYLGMAMGLCPPAATVIGGQIHERVGWQGNFVAMAVVALVLFVAAWRGLPIRPPREPAATHWFREMLAGYALLARQREFPLYVVVLAASVAAFYSFLAGAPIVLRSYGVGPAGVGWYVMVVPLAFVLGNFVNSRLIVRVGQRRVMMAGQVLTLIGIAMVIVLGAFGPRTPLVLSLPLLLMGFGHGLFMPICLAGTVGLIPAVAGTAAAVAGLAQQFSGALGGYLVGLVSHDGPVNLATVMLGFTVIATVAQARLRVR
ncbi:MAG: Bcr/CflA family efflux MFS transporter [Burkholderiaceae bacterium]